MHALPVVAEGLDLVLEPGRGRRHVGAHLPTYDERHHPTRPTPCPEKLEVASGSRSAPLGQARHAASSSTLAYRAR